MERNLFLEIAFDGSHYHGWQIQQNAVTVQEVFQDALFKILGEKPKIKGCSRTDSGVHANMYCISLKTDRNIPERRLMGALNHFLPDSISVLECREVGEDFHARYSCTKKRYVYRIWNKEQKNPFLANRALHYWYKIDEELLNREAKHFIGTHDFTSFCTLDQRVLDDATRTMFDCSVERIGDEIRFSVVGDGFLYNMVRIMVGTLLKVQQGKIKEGQIKDIILLKDRSKAGPKAPAHGLYLDKVYYL